MLAILAVALPLLRAASSSSSSSASCEDCDHNEPWRPLFKPSQIIHSEFPEHRLHRSLELEDSFDDGPQQPPPANSIDTKVKSYSNGGRRWVEWDHYGDVTSTKSQSYEDRSSSPSGTREGAKAPPNSQEMEDFLTKSGEHRFFGDEHLFDERSDPSRAIFSEDMKFSKEFSFSNEAQTSNSFEPIESGEGHRRYKNPVATSYSAMSSIFTGVRPRSRELRPSISLYDLSRLVKSHPVSHSRFFNGRNVTNQYLVHQPATSEGSQNVSSRGQPPPPPPPYVPLTHPVYRYVKPPLSSAFFRSPSPHYQHMEPYLRLQNHKTLIRHVVPTKNPFSETFWKGFKRSSNEQSSTGRSLYILKKNPNIFDLKRIKKRQNPNQYVYIIKRNTRLS